MIGSIFCQNEQRKVRVVSNECHCIGMYILRHQHKLHPGTIRQSLYTSINRPIHWSTEPQEWSWTWPETLDTKTREEELHDITTIAAGKGGDILVFVGGNGGCCVCVKEGGSCEVVALKCEEDRARVAEIFEMKGVGVVVVVGYESGVVRFFGVDGRLRGVSKVGDVEVTSIKFVASFVFKGCVRDVEEDEENCGLFVRFGGKGLVGKVSVRGVRGILEESLKFGYVADGKGWVVWKLAHDCAVDAAPAGEEPPAITEESSDGSIRVVSVGVSPSIVATACSGEPSLSAGAVAVQAVGAIFGAARGLLYSKRGAVGVQQQKATEQPVAGLASVSLDWNDNSAEHTDALQVQKSVQSYTRFNVRGNARRSVKAASSIIRSQVAKSAKAIGPNASNAADLIRDSTGLKRPRSRGSMDEPNSANMVSGNASNGISRNNSRVTSVGENPLTVRVRALTRVFPNSRIAQSVSIPPQPSTLFAIADNIGRVALHDSRDLCLVRLYKGHRDAQLAWITGYKETLLAIYSPPTCTLSLYSPLKNLRAQHTPLISFQLPSRSLMATNYTNYQLIFVAPSGHTFVLKLAKKGGYENSASPVASEETDNIRQNQITKLFEDFIRFCKEENIEAACKMLSETSSKESAYLLSQLVTRKDTDVSAECHGAVAQFAAARSPVPVRYRFDAHFRLATAASLLSRKSSGDNESPTSTSPPSNPLIADVIPACEQHDTLEKGDTLPASLCSVRKFIQGHSLCLRPCEERRDGDSNVLMLRRNKENSRQILRMYFERSSGFDESINVVLKGTLGYTPADVGEALGEYLLEASLKVLSDAVESDVVREHLGLWPYTDMCDKLESSERVGNGLVIIRIMIAHRERHNDIHGHDGSDLFTLMERLDACVKSYRILKAQGFKGRSSFAVTAESVTPGTLAGESVAVYVLIANGCFEAGMKVMTACTAISESAYQLRQVGQNAVQGARLVMRRALDSFGHMMTISSEVRDWITSGSSRYGVKEESPMVMTKEYVHSLGEGLGGVLRVAMSCLEDASVESVRCWQLAGVTSELSTTVMSHKEDTAMLELDSKIDAPSQTADKNAPKDL